MVVSINDIVSVCQGDCSYHYSGAKTPILHSITPNKGKTGGSLCTEVTISCTGCLAGTENNDVMIGDAPCNVTSATVSEIKCCLGKRAMETFFIFFYLNLFLYIYLSLIHI